MFQAILRCWSTLEWRSVKLQSGTSCLLWRASPVRSLINCTSHRSCAYMYMYMATLFSSFIRPVHRSPARREWRISELDFRGRSWSLHLHRSRWNGKALKPVKTVTRSLIFMLLFVSGARDSCSAGGQARLLRCSAANPGNHHWNGDPARHLHLRRRSTHLTLSSCCLSCSTMFTCAYVSIG